MSDEPYRDRPGDAAWIPIRFQPTGGPWLEMHMTGDDISRLEQLLTHARDDLHRFVDSQVVDP